MEQFNLFNLLLIYYSKNKTKLKQNKTKQKQKQNKTKQKQKKQKTKQNKTYILRKLDPVQLSLLQGTLICFGRSVRSCHG